jgi:hypothetical protein
MQKYSKPTKLIIIKNHFLSLRHTIDDLTPLLTEKEQAAKVVMTLNFMLA